MSWRGRANVSYLPAYELSRVDSRVALAESEKYASTIALNPKEFEIENLKVQRDALKSKLTKRDSEAKDLNERLEILGTRCRLFEQQINNQLY